MYFASSHRQVYRAVAKIAMSETINFFILNLGYRTYNAHGNIAADQWNRKTGPWCKLNTLLGGHFFSFTAGNNLVDRINKSLEEM